MSDDDALLRKVLASTPVDAMAGRVTSPGFRYEPGTKVLNAENDVPFEMVPVQHVRTLIGIGEDFTGRRIGELTVLGLSRDPGPHKAMKKKGRLWVARCSCGRYVLRRSHSILRPKETDACQHCRHKAHLRRTDAWRQSARAQAQKVGKA